MVPAKLSTVAGTLVINEIYLSLQGESTFAGLPCIFIRLTACNLRCSYCDTAYAFTEGKKQSLENILAGVSRLASPFRQKPPVGDDVRRLTSTPHLSRRSRTKADSTPLPLVELTGGEPLLQKESLPLLKSLCDEGFTVLLATSGAHDIYPLD